MVSAGKKRLISLIMVAAASFNAAISNTALPVPARSEIISAEEQGCGFSPDMDQQNTIDVKPGNWGGTGISFIIEKGRVAIELNCASIDVASELKARKDGRFTAAGLLKSNGPGPIRLDSKPQRVRLEGKITGKELKLKITIADTGEVLGDFALERDKGPILHRCR